MTSTVASQAAPEVRPDIEDRGHEERKNRKATTPPEQPAASAKQPSRKSTGEDVSPSVGSDCSRITD